MSKALTYGVCATLFSQTLLVQPVAAGTILAAYSGSYSIITSSPVSEGIVSLRLAMGPLFADCDAPAACVQLGRFNALGDAASGSVFTLENQPAIQAALTDGVLDLFSLAMNFGAVYSPVLSGGGVGIFDTPLAAGYSGEPIESITFTIDRLLFQTVSIPLGFGTQATLEYTLAVHGPAGKMPPIATAAVPLAHAVLIETPPVATPEPATWLAAVCGLAAVLWRRGLSKACA